MRRNVGHAVREMCDVAAMRFHHIAHKGELNHADQSLVLAVMEGMAGEKRRVTCGNVATTLGERARILECERWIKSERER